MNTIKNTASTQTILAVDLGKYKSVACIYRSAEDQQFTTITTSSDWFGAATELEAALRFRLRASRAG